MILILIGIFLVIAVIMALNFRAMENEIKDLKFQNRDFDTGNYALNEAILMLENDNQVLSDSLASQDSIIVLQKQKIDYYYDFYRRSIITTPTGKVVVPLGTFKEAKRLVITHDTSFHRTPNIQ